MTDRQKEIILALAEHDMNQQRAARAIYTSSTTVRFHINKIKECTGLDPMNFFDLAKLYERVKGRK